MECVLLGLSCLHHFSVVCAEINFKISRGLPQPFCPDGVSARAASSESVAESLEGSPWASKVGVAAVAKSRNLEKIEVALEFVVGAASVGAYGL